MDAILDSLVGNSRQALLASIEIHNKPVFPYRYQLSTILLINAWELLLKAFLYVNRGDVKLVGDDGTTKPFEECLACVASTIGSGFAIEKENIERLYDFRCDYIHFYQDNIDPVLYGLLAKGVQLYARFLLKFFEIDLCEETHLILLPVGFKPPVSPIDFLSKKSTLENATAQVQDFLKKVIVSTEHLEGLGIEEPIMYTFSMSVENEKRVKNADIVAAITKNSQLAAIHVPNILQGVKISNQEDAKLIKVEEESLFLTVFIHRSREVYLNAHNMFPNLKQNKEYHDLMNKAKADPNLYRFRYVDMQKQSGMGQGFYSVAIYDLLREYYGNGESNGPEIFYEAPQ